MKNLTQCKGAVMILLLSFTVFANGIYGQSVSKPDLSAQELENLRKVRSGVAKTKWGKRLTFVGLVFTAGTLGLISAAENYERSAAKSREKLSGEIPLLYYFFTATAENAYSNADPYDTEAYGSYLNGLSTAYLLYWQLSTQAVNDAARLERRAHSNRAGAVVAGVFALAFNITGQILGKSGRRYVIESPSQASSFPLSRNVSMDLAVLPSKRNSQIQLKFDARL